MPTLFVATNGLSIWTSTDLGVTLARMPTSTALYSGSRVWSLLETPSGLMAELRAAPTAAGRVLRRPTPAAPRWIHSARCVDVSVTHWVRPAIGCPTRPEDSRPGRSMRGTHSCRLQATPSKSAGRRAVVWSRHLHIIGARRSNIFILILAARRSMSRPAFQKKSVSKRASSAPVSATNSIEGDGRYS